MTDAEAELPVTRADAVALTAAVDRLAAKFKWQQRLTAGLIAAFVGVCIALGLGALALVQVRHENACVASLAAATADRTGVLTPLSTTRTTAQDTQQDAEANLLFHAITTFSLTPAQRQAALEPDVRAFTSAHQAYQSADDAYKAGVLANPPPKTPAFHC